MLLSSKHSYFDSLYLMDQAGNLVPGLKKALCFYYNPFNKHIEASIKESKNESIEDLALENDFDLPIVLESRKGKQSVSWLTEEDLPFNLKKTNSIQREVFDELDNIVLLLRIPNKDDGKMDLLYLFINADSSNFGLRKHDDVLKTDNKSIISQLIHNSFRQLISQRTNYFQENQNLKEHYALLQSKIEKQKKGIKLNQQDSHNQLLNYCQFILNSISKEIDIHIEMNRDVIELLSNYNGSIQNIDTLIRNACQRARDTALNPFSPIVTLEDFHFDEMDQGIYNDSNKDVNPDSRYMRSFALLEKLEDAARKLVAHREKLTGANVGKAMPTPISAAAISDAIKKHQSKINSLCAIYPDRWKIIRNEFRPIMNVLHSA